MQEKSRVSVLLYTWCYVWRTRKLWLCIAHIHRGKTALILWIIRIIEPIPARDKSRVSLACRISSSWCTAEISFFLNRVESKVLRKQGFQTNYISCFHIELAQWTIIRCERAGVACSIINNNPCSSSCGHFSDTHCQVSWTCFKITQIWTRLLFLLDEDFSALNPDVLPWLTLCHWP